MWRNHGGDREQTNVLKSPRMWDTFHTKVPTEESYLRHVHPTALVDQKGKNKVF